MSLLEATAQLVDIGHLCQDAREIALTQIQAFSKPTVLKCKEAIRKRLRAINESRAQKRKQAGQVYGVPLSGSLLTKPCVFPEQRPCGEDFRKKWIEIEKTGLELGCLLLGFPFVVEAFRKLRAIEDVGEMLQVSMCQVELLPFYMDKNELITVGVHSLSQVMSPHLDCRMKKSVSCWNGVRCVGHGQVSLSGTEQVCSPVSVGYLNHDIGLLQQDYLRKGLQRLACEKELWRQVVVGKYEEGKGRCFAR
ncbi:Mediator of RNA polymerase II transcription subunit 12 [Vitis vinifera]|uniref:Mediator of RNA polymerase II transcription subunit 12 n=1 Tax=Vitis vinifera TaxID=29760 RepID=A0A438JMA9_VITVI|nr:Mediator of RNA polymerase II transcription subunit 12 [Vitis vinifera]